MEENKGKKRPVDDAGIRLAPTPIRNDDMNVLPAIRQDFIISPHIEIDEKDDIESETASTLKDYQPKKEDMSKRWKRRQRAKNVMVGSIMFLVTVFAVLPYILGACGVSLSWAFKYIPEDNNALINFINAFKETASLGWSGEEVKSIWLNAIPDMVIVIGIIALAINLFKSIYAIFGAVKQLKYVGAALIYLICILAVFIASLVGVSAIGIEKIDFINDFINDCGNSELFTLMITSIGYLFVSFVIYILGRDKQGYLI